MRTSTGSVILALVLTVGWWTSVAAQQGATDGQWRYYGGGPGGTAYSPLDQIDATVGVGRFPGQPVQAG